MAIKFDTERDLENEIFDFVTKNKKCPITESVVHRCFRQLQIKGYGVPDLVYFRYSGFYPKVTVVELKNVELNPDHLNQLCRYMTGIRRCLNRHLIDEKANITINGVLAGPMAKTDFVMMFQEIGNIDVYKIDVSIERGVCFNEVYGWRRTAEDLTCLDPKIRRCLRLRKDINSKVEERMKTRRREWEEARAKR